MPVTTIDEVIDRLIVLFEDVDGINSAVAGWMNEPVTEYELPIVTIVEGAESYTPTLNNRGYGGERAYYATLLVGPAIEPTIGTDIAGRVTVRPFMKSILDAFMTNVTLAYGSDAGLPNVQFARITRTGPPDKMDFAGSTYWGAFFEIIVTTNYRL